MKWLIGFGVGIALFLFIAGIPLVMFISSANFGNQTEQTIEAQVKVNQNTLSNMTQQVIEVAKVPGMYKEDLKEVISAAIEGRYGEDGIGGPGGSMLVAIQEAYPGQMDSSLYATIQMTISAKRDEFKNAQDMLTDKVRVYRTKLGEIPTGWFLGLAGYPKIDLTAAKYNPIISASTGQAFETGVDEGIKF